MKVCVVGLWHLGTVTAACLASFGHRVVGLDPDCNVIAKLRTGRAPLFEPNLDDLIAKGLHEETLRFTSDPAAAISDAEIIWIAYDTPVDDEDVADVESVQRRVRDLFTFLAPNSVVLVSSQLIAGCTRQLQQAFARTQPGRRVDFAYSPENLRLGNAIKVFTQPDRVVVGADSDHARELITKLLSPLADRLLWMSIESAEMTKHALNAFLALSVTFANELAAICEHVGADAKEVERGLKSEARIGPGAYLAPGAAFAGGTLARDVQYLNVLGQRAQQRAPLLAAIKESNDRHRQWTARKLEQRFGKLAGRRIAILGLTYKPGTDTLRRSSSIELCRWLLAQGANVVAHDPRVQHGDSELPKGVDMQATPDAAFANADAVVIGTAWPEYRALDASTLVAAMPKPVVIDAARFADKNLNLGSIEYIAIGTPAAEGAAARRSS